MKSSRPATAHGQEQNLRYLLASRASLHSAQAQLINPSDILVVDQQKPAGGGILFSVTMLSGTKPLPVKVVSSS